MICFARRSSSIVNQTNNETVSNSTLGKLVRDRIKALQQFPCIFIPIKTSFFLEEVVLIILPILPQKDSSVFSNRIIVEYLRDFLPYTWIFCLEHTHTCMQRHIQTNLYQMDYAIVISA